MSIFLCVSGDGKTVSLDSASFFEVADCSGESWVCCELDDDRRVTSEILQVVSGVRSLHKKIADEAKDDSEASTTVKIVFMSSSEFDTETRLQAVL
ncbi:MAG: hypothetical protein U0805_06390 [Pirellulales bacterium]